ncbi:MAG: hypothetical protein SPE97_09685 [Hallerella succinigenes]|nr:hypothetical protein [Hallerella succinigenes]
MAAHELVYRLHRRPLEVLPHLVKSPYKTEESLPEKRDSFFPEREPTGLGYIFLKNLESVLTMSKI